MTVHNDLDKTIQYQKFHDIARRRWGRTTPYRLGIAVGSAGENLETPSGYGVRAARSYRDGLARGLENWKREKAGA